MYVEFCKGIKDRGNIVEFGTVQPVKRDYECYISLFPFDNSINDYIKQNGSISGYKGKHYLPYICFDIDIDGDIDLAKESTMQLIKELGKRGVSSDEVYIFFSGNKGFHVNITDKVYGKIEPSETITNQIKEWVVSNFGHIKGIDSVIYEPHRLIRVSNSKHPKSGLYKVPLTYDELCNGNMIELAFDARQINHIKNSDIKFSQQIRDEILTPVHNEKDEGVKLNTGFFSPANKGNRNQRYFEQASTLFKNTNLTSKSIFEIVSSINSASNEPIPEREIEALIKSAEKYRPGTQEISFQTFGELVPEWIEYHSEEEKPLVFGLNELDNEFSGKLRGQLGLIVGYGGSKKSIIAQNICFHNILTNHRTLYSNMEMGAPKLMDRFIDMMVNNSENNASYDLQRSMKRNFESVQNILTDEISREYSDKLLLCQNGSMTADDYDKLLIKAKNEIGPVDILVVDGLSMMGGNGTENEVYTKNSKELKELAKKHNIFIPLIAHASRGEKQDTRSLIRHIRGSEKIMDNCDFVITMSLIKNNDAWSRDFGVYNLWNKRGTGNTIEKVFRFDTKRLLMVDYEGDNIDILGNDNVF